MPGSTPRRTWSTAAVPEGEQFTLWEEVVHEAFVEVSLTRAGTGPFVSAVAARSVGSLDVARIVSPAQSVARTSSQVNARPGDVFFLNLSLSGESFLSQDGRSARLAPNDFAIIDSGRPFALRFERRFEQVSLTLPHDLLAPLLSSPRDATALRVRGDRGLGAVASAALRALAASEESIDRHSARSLTDQLSGLIALALGGLRAPPAFASVALLLGAALEEIDRSLGDPELCPGHVAERVGISTRYLHRLFCDHGQSFGHFVLERRLGRCHRDLSEPAHSHWTIGEIACEHGFKDPSYFARAFKARYGISPRALRRGVAHARLPSV